MGEDKVEKIDHPKWYGGASNPYEVIKVIEDWGLSFKAGNALKYIYRAGNKPGSSVLDDLSKARWYLSRLAEFTKQRGEFVDHIIEHIANGAAPLKLSVFRVIGEENGVGLDPFDRLIELDELLKAWNFSPAYEALVTAIFEGDWAKACEQLEELIHEEG